MPNGKKLITPLLLLANLLAGCGPAPERQALLDGARALQAGQNERASIFFEASHKTARTAAQRATALNFFGIAMLRQGQQEQAAAAFRESAMANEHFAAPRYNLAVLADDQGRENEALALLDEAATAEPRSTSALEYAAAIHIRRQRWDFAHILLNKALANDPRSASVLTGLALLDIQAERYAAARSRLQKAASLEPGYAPAIYHLALACANLPNAERDAERYYDQFLALSPPEPQADLARSALAALRSHAATLQPAPMPPSQPESKPAHTMSFDNARMLAAAGRKAAAVNLYLRAADEAEQAGQPEIAHQARKQAQAVCPQEPEPLLTLAEHWLEHGCPDLAKPLATQALAARPNWPEALLIMAKLAITAQHYDEALGYLATALARQPPPPDALRLRANLYAKHLSNTTKAIQDLRLFMRIHPNDPHAPEASAQLKQLETGTRPQ